MAAASAFSAWLVQMLQVAFSRRMCCSRVAQGQHVAALAVDVHRLADDAAGRLADVLLACMAKKPRYGPPKLRPIAQRLALAGHDVGAVLAGRL